MILVLLWHDFGISPLVVCILCWQKVQSIIRAGKIVISNTVKGLENYENSNSQMNVAVKSVQKQAQRKYDER